MRTPKVTLYALIAIAAWDSLATISAATEPSPLPNHTDADADPTGKPTPSIKAEPSPETTQQRTFSTPSSGTGAAKTSDRALSPTLAQLKNRLLKEFSSLENSHPVLLWMQNPSSIPPISPQATPSSPPASAPATSQESANPEPVGSKAAAPLLVNPAQPTSAGSVAPAPNQSAVTDAAFNLALQMIESGQFDRAQQMAQLLPPERQADILKKIQASAPPAPLKATETPLATPPVAANSVSPNSVSTSKPPDSAPALAASTVESTPSPTVAPPEPRIIAAAPARPEVLEPATMALPNPPQRRTAPVAPDLPAPPDLLAYLQQPQVPSASGMIFPLAGEAPITSPFGWRTHPISGQQRFHSGTDFGAPEGTPVLAALQGRVTKADWTGGYGLAIEIEHQNGEMDTFYAHLSKALVKAGDWVDQGTVIGNVGNTGYTTGPHLHFEVRHHTTTGWVEVDPMTELGQSPTYANPSPVSPLGDSLSQLPAAQFLAQAIRSAVPSTRPIPNYSVASLADLKVAAVPVSMTARAATKQALSSPSQLPTAPTGSLPQVQMPELPSFSPPQLPALPGTAPAASLPGSAAAPSLPGAASASSAQPAAQDRFNNLKIEDYGYWSDLCQSLVKGGQFADAVAACDRTIALKPDALEPWLYRGQALEGLKQYTEAIANYGYVLHREPKHAESLTYQCRTFLKLGNPDAALEACDQALAANQFWGQASPAVAWHLRGQVLTQQGQHEEALKAYERALRTDGERSEFLLARCQALFQLGRYQDVLNACDEAMAINQQWGDGSPAQALQMQGRALAKLGRQQDAIATFDQALSRDLKNADIWADQGQLLYDLGRYNDALNSFQQATQLKPTSSQALIGQAAALNELKQYEPALQSVDQALQGDGNWGSLTAGFIWDQRAQALGGLGKYDEALAAANRATGLQPDYAKAWNNRAVILWHLEQYDEAVASTQTAIKLEPTYAQAWFNQGRLYSTTKQYQQALNAYDQVQRLNPTAVTANFWINHAAVLWHLNRSTDALADLDKALKLDPQSSEALINRGIVLLSMKRFEDAIAAYDRALKINPQASAAWYGRGTALMKLNRTEEATAAFAHVSS